MTAVVAATRTKKGAAAAEAEPSPWPSLARAGVARIAEMLFQAEQSGACVDSPVQDLLSDADMVLCFMRQAAESESLWTGQDPSYACYLIRAARRVLSQALELQFKEGGANDVQIAVLPTAIALLAELEDALILAPHNMGRLLAFDSWRVVTTPQSRPTELTSNEEHNDVGERRSLAFDANQQISLLAGGLKQLLEQERNDKFLMYHGILSRIEQMTEVVFYATNIYVGKPEEALDLVSLKRIFEGMSA
jgi:hypothetical protein